MLFKIFTELLYKTMKKNDKLRNQFLIYKITFTLECLSFIKSNKILFIPKKILKINRTD